MAPVSIRALHIEVPILVGEVVPCSIPMITSSIRFISWFDISISTVSFPCRSLFNVFGSIVQGGDSCLLHSHCSPSVRRLSLSSCSKSLSWVASESYSSFKDSSSIACTSSVISCMSAAVCLALSLRLLHKFTEGPAVVTAFVVDLAMFSFLCQEA